MPSTFVTSRWLFLRLLGLVYLIAFASLGVQITGLVGERGILPIGEFLPQVREVYGAQAYRFLPTVVWVAPTDWFLSLLCWGGVALSILLIAGIAPTAVLAVLWASYLSLTIAGQVFLQFQWDGLLLESGLLACLYAPLAWRSRLRDDPEPSTIVRWVVWSLAFKLTFLSGITKIASGDETWANWTALTYHYETQPIPAWTSWFAHQMPAWFHYWSAAGLFAIELVAPFAVFLPTRFRRLRLTACALMILLQLVIGATGNYGFFNLLAIVLYLTLLDDGTLRPRPLTLASFTARGAPPPLALLLDSQTRSSQRPRALSPGTGEREERVDEPRAWRVAASVVALIVAFLSLLTFYREIDTTRARRGPLVRGWPEEMLSWVSPLRSINGYGLFRVMTTERPEIVIEVSANGTEWCEYEFRWKAGDPMRRPSFVQPHMPRLDWQMWFAALDPRDAQYWLERLLRRVMNGDAAVLALLGPNPLSEAPQYARLAYYDYQFTSRAERAESAAWWKRKLVGYLTDTISRR